MKRTEFKRKPKKEKATTPCGVFIAKARREVKAGAFVTDADVEVAIKKLFRKPVVALVVRKPLRAVGRRGKRLAPLDAAWRKAVFTRDGRKCQLYGEHFGELHAHHIFGKKSNPRLRHAVDNGITLCAVHHDEVHKNPEDGRLRIKHAIGGPRWAALEEAARTRK